MINTLLTLWMVPTLLLGMRTSLAETKPYPTEGPVALTTLEKDACYSRQGVILQLVDKYSNTLLLGAPSEPSEIHVTLPASKRALNLLLVGNRYWRISNPAKTKIAKLLMRSSDLILVKGDVAGVPRETIPVQDSTRFSNCEEGNETSRIVAFQSLESAGSLLAYVGRTSGSEIAVPPLDLPGQEPAPDDLGHPPPSFSCKNVKTAIERRICGNADLSALDVALAKAFGEYVAASAEVDRKLVSGEQRAWLRSRDECKTNACLREIMQARQIKLGESKDKVVNFRSSSDLTKTDLKVIGQKSRPLLKKKYALQLADDELTSLDHLACMGFNGSYVCRAFYEGCASRQGGGRCCSGFDIATEPTSGNERFAIKSVQLTTLKEACRDE